MSERRVILTTCLGLLLGVASAQPGYGQGIAASALPSQNAGVGWPPTERSALFPDIYGGWFMWWSVNREEFLEPASPAAASASRPADAAVVQPLTDDERRNRVIPALLAALDDGERQVRDAAAVALGRCGDGREVAALVKATLDRDRSASEGAMLGLGMIGAGPADDALVKILADPSSGARKRGLVALALGLSGGDAGRAPLFDDLGAGRPVIAEASRAIGAALWAGADRKDPRTDRAQQAASLIQKALAKDPKNRKLLCFGLVGLSKTRDPGSLAFVLDAVRDPRFDVRGAAAIAAGRIIRADDAKSVHVLIAALEAEGHPLPFRFMIPALGRIGGADARKALMKQLDSGEETHRAFAALALGIAGATEVAPRLRQQILGPTEDPLKGAFIVALGLMKDAEALGPVTQIASGRASDEVIAQCMWCFALLRNHDAVPAIEHVLEHSKAADTQECAAIALGVMGAVEASPFLAKVLLEEKSATPRIAAAAGLGRMGDSRGLEPLLKALARRDEPPAVRAAAAAGLGTLAQRSPWCPLARIAIDSYYGLQNEAIDEITTRMGGLMKKTGEGGSIGKR